MPKTPIYRFTVKTSAWLNGVQQTLYMDGPDNHYVKLTLAFPTDADHAASTPCTYARARPKQTFLHTRRERDAAGANATANAATDARAGTVGLIGIRAHAATGDAEDDVLVVV